MRKKIILFSGLLLLLILLMSGLANAKPNTISLTWWTIDNGGGAATGGNLTLTGTIGQPDSGDLSGGQYTLTGGFWSPVSGNFIYLPLIMANGCRRLRIIHLLCAAPPIRYTPNSGGGNTCRIIRRNVLHLPSTGHDFPLR